MRWIAAGVVAFVISIVGFVFHRRPQPLHLVFVGDVMLSRSVGDAMLRRGDWDWPFERIASATAAADLTFGNLETPISVRGSASGCGYCFRADPRAVSGLVYAGFDVMSVANNHAHDYGPSAFADTVRLLGDAGIGAAYGDDAVVRTVGATKVGFLAFTYPLDQARITADIARARPSADVLVVSFHDGVEYQTAHDAEQQRVYRAAVDAGADLVVGTHPHVVQEVERYRDRWIAYSLGNFIFDQAWSPPTMHGLLLDVTVADGRIAELATRSVDISAAYQASLHP